MNWVQQVGETFLVTFVHNWPYLLIGVLLAAAAEAFLDRARLMRGMTRSEGLAVVAATLLGALTPLCSCGTVAVLLSLLATGLPWAPVVAFLVSSPLMSPAIYAITAGALGQPMALARLGTALALGLAAGGLALVMERRGWMPATVKAARPQPEAACGCSQPAGGGAGDWRRRLKEALVRQGRFVLGYFALFTLFAAVVEVSLPTAWVQALFGGAHAFSIPLAAVLGVPLYVSGVAAVPMVASLQTMGMSKGAALAFLVAGPGTHIGALGAVAVIAPRRLLWLYLGVVFLGAVAAGYVYQWV